MDTNYEQKRQTLEQENDLLDKINDMQTAVRSAVIKREWADFEKLLLSMNGYKEQFEALEKERMGLFSDSVDAEGNTPHFYTLIAKLPETERREFADIYRKIKERALKVRLANDSLALYLEEAKTTLNAFMKAAFPIASGNTYSRKGMKIEADMTALVINQAL
ncbi:MAG: flagellar export chaperone FlgN [Treponema sp.]|nr:flagellar export chaperone FlgN [Treponema sp.]